jgi:hypothetical protein
MNQKKFLSYAEASRLVQEIGVTNRSGYNALARTDRRLPSNPSVSYTEWTDWYTFLGKERKSIYPTIEEAKAAAQALGFITGKEYRAGYHEDPRLPSTPYQAYRNKGWEHWASFLRNETQKNIYSTYAEAREATLRLGVKTGTEYQQRRVEDVRLPSNPECVYRNKGWISMPHFIDIPDRFYENYEEASAAAKKLGVKTYLQYTMVRKADPKLPSTPQLHYKGKGWKSWYHFIGTEKRCYYNYKDAAAAAIGLKICTRDEYNRRRKEDQRLPKSPQSVYSGAWISWPAFLGTTKERTLYDNYEEARAAAAKCGLKSSGEYKLKCKICDPLLPSVPYKTFQNKGWTDWYDFLGNERPLVAPPKYSNMCAAIEQWLEDERNLIVKRRALHSFLYGFYNSEGLPDITTHILQHSQNFNTEEYQNFIDSRILSVRRKTHNSVVSFYTWVLQKFCTDYTSDAPKLLPGFRNPFQNELAGYENSIPLDRPSQSTKATLSYEYILRARKYLSPRSDNIYLTKPSLSDLEAVSTIFNSRADWRDVPKSLIDFADPNCVWREFKTHRYDDKGKKRRIEGYQLWSPARFVALYTLLRYPLRGQQILWLDSGEGDTEIPILDNDTHRITWTENHLPLSIRNSDKRHNQGAVQRGHRDEPKLHVTTNKTSRVDGSYEVEWIPDDLVYWFLLLRDWQIKYNPVARQTPWTEIPGIQRFNQKLMKARGTQCFLFRGNGTHVPISTNTAFESTLPALLYTIQREGENLAELDITAVGTQYVSYYTPHSLRVSLITAFIAEDGALLPIVSKLVGHSSIVMTIYYTKLNSGQMRRILGEAEKKTALRATEELSTDIRNKGLGEFRELLIATNSIACGYDQATPGSACIIFDYGICPVSGSRCHVGCKASTDAIQFSPVEHGYLGQKNCVRCRFFVTGVPFLGGLVSLANEISLEVHVESGRFQKYSSDVLQFENIYYDAIKNGEPDQFSAQRKSAIAHEQQSAAKLDSLLTDYTAVNTHVTEVITLTNSRHTSRDESIRLISSGEPHELGLTFDDSVSGYHLLAEICQNATIYKSVDPSRAVPLISQAIDQMASNNHMLPAMYRLTDEQKLVTINELNRLLLQRLKSWEDIDNLFSGKLTLLDINAHEPNLIPITDEVLEIFSRSTVLHLTGEN